MVVKRVFFATTSIIVYARFLYLFRLCANAKQTFLVVGNQPNGKYQMKRAAPIVFVLFLTFVAAAVFAGEPAGSPEAEADYWPTHAWRTSTPEAQGMDSEVLAQAFDYIRQHHVPIHSWLIVRNGYVVLDAYFFPFQGHP